MAVSRANVAVQVMRHLCECPLHGYSQPGRFGTSGYCGVATDAGAAGCGIVDVEFEGGSLGPGGWFTKNMEGDRLIGLTVFYDTPNPSATGYYEALYRCHWMGSNPAWGKWEHDDDDGGAGNDVDQVDMIEPTIVPC